MSRVIPTLVPLLLVAPGAATDEPPLSLAAEEFSSPVLPVSEVGSTTVRLTVSCAVVLQNPPSLQVALSAITTNPDADVGISPSTVFFRSADCADETTHDEVRLEVRFEEDVEGLQNTTVRVQASAAGHVAIATVNVTAAYVGRMDVEPLTATLQRRDSDEIAPLALRIRNEGNAQSKIAFASATSGWVLRPPSDVLLNRGAEAIHLLEFDTDSSDSESIVRIKYDVYATSDSSLHGEPGTLEIPVEDTTPAIHLGFIVLACSVASVLHHVASRLTLRGAATRPGWQGRR